MHREIESVTLLVAGKRIFDLIRLSINCLIWQEVWRWTDKDSFSNFTVLPRTPRALPSHPFSCLWQIGFILVAVTSWIQDAASSPGIMSTHSSPTGKQEKNAFLLWGLSLKPFPFPGQKHLLSMRTPEHSLVKENEIIIAILDQSEFSLGLDLPWNWEISASYVNPKSRSCV